LVNSQLCIDARYHAQGSEVALTDCKEKGGADQVRRSLLSEAASIGIGKVVVTGVTIIYDLTY